MYMNQNEGCQKNYNRKFIRKQVLTDRSVVTLCVYVEANLKLSGKSSNEWS